MKKVLFVCIENSCRSQMAEAFAKLHGKDKAEVYSAGSESSGVIHPKAIEAMKAIDYDLSHHASKSIDQLPESDFDYVISMGCGDACPRIPAKIREDWEIPDPKNMPPEEFNKIRDIIESEVIHLIENL